MSEPLAQCCADPFPLTGTFSIPGSERIAIICMTCRATALGNTEEEARAGWNNRYGSSADPDYAELRQSLRKYEELGPLGSVAIHPETPGYTTGQVWDDARKASRAILDLIRQRNEALGENRRLPKPYQDRVQDWMLECFGAEIAADGLERSHRFLEEALELAQACGATAEDARKLTDYVFGRPVGERAQEVGGVMVTLAALCTTHLIEMISAAETELARVWTKVDAIRAKQASKPKNSPLPQKA